jgi:hypothetical protein
VADIERRLHTNLVWVEGVDTVSSGAVASGASSRGAVSISLFRDGVDGAAEELGEQAGQAEADRGHARTDNANLALEHGPQTGLEVVPGHVGCVCEVDEGAQAEHRDDGYAGKDLLAGCCGIFPLGWEGRTYNAPTLNMSRTPIFFFIARCRFQICVMGSESVRKSRRMLKAAWVKASVLLLTHLPLCSPSHCFHAKLTGEQTKTAAMVKASVEAKLKAMTPQTMRRKRFSGKICR